jgi:hypothetical protein
MNSSLRAVTACDSFTIGSAATNSLPPFLLTLTLLHTSSIVSLNMSILASKLLRPLPRAARVFGLRRCYSIHADHAAPRLADLDPSILSITRTVTPKALQPEEKLVFGREFTGRSCSFKSTEAC